MSNPDRPCICTPAQIRQYKARISGPLMDRLDIQVEVPRLSYDDLSGACESESSAQIRTRVKRARKIQNQRFSTLRQNAANQPLCFANAGMNQDMISNHCRLSTQSGNTLKQAMETLKLSARAYSSILKLARTIADLAGEEKIKRSHILEAIQYKSFDREDEAGGY